MALTDMVLMPGADYQAICNATRTLTGKTEALKSGDISAELGTVTPQTETWVLNPTLTMTQQEVYSVKFTSNGTEFNEIRRNGRALVYCNSQGDTQVGSGPTSSSITTWVDEAYRKIVLSNASAGTYIEWWLQGNGVKQPANLAVQSSKDVTITSNGTTEITPDAPYDVMEKANLTVNVPTGGSVDMRTINITVDGQGVSDIEDWAVNCSYGTNVLTLDSGTPSASISVPNQTIFVIYISPDMLVDVSGIDEAIMFDVLGVSGSYAHLTEFPDSFIYVCSLNATGGNSSFTLALSLRKNPNYL